MSKLMITLCATAGLALAGTAAAQMAPSSMPAPPLSKDGYALAKSNAESQYKIDKKACDSLSANAKDVCVAQAKGKENVAKADAQAAYENTPKARENARVELAKANYDIAIEMCDDQAGNPKDVCVKEAKAGLVKGKADAKVDRVAADTRQDGAAKRADARVAASADKRDAEYKVAIEKCDDLAGAAKDSCVSGAKVRFGKS
jgi:hypothetical protein